MRLPPNELFVTSDIHEGFKQGKAEVTEPAPALEVGPLRNEGASVRSPPQWTNQGGMGPQQQSAVESIQWNRAASERQDELHAKLAAQGRDKSQSGLEDLHPKPTEPQPSPENTHNALHQQFSDEQTMAPNAGRSTDSGMRPASSTAQHLSHDELHAALGISVLAEQTGGRDGASTHDKLMDMANAPQTDAAAMAWESRVPHDHDLGR